VGGGWWFLVAEHPNFMILDISGKKTFGLGEILGPLETKKDSPRSYPSRLYGNRQKPCNIFIHKKHLTFREGYVANNGNIKKS